MLYRWKIPDVMINKDHCVYVKHSKDSFLTLSLYVDDILAGNNKDEGCG